MSWPRVQPADPSDPHVGPVKPHVGPISDLLSQHDISEVHFRFARFRLNHTVCSCMLRIWSYEIAYETKMRFGCWVSGVARLQAIDSAGQPLASRPLWVQPAAEAPCQPPKSAYDPEITIIAFRGTRFYFFDERFMHILILTGTHIPVQQPLNSDNLSMRKMGYRCCQMV